MSSPFVRRAAQVVVLAGSGLMFYAKLSDGTLFFYINQRFAWLSLLAALLYVALALTVLYSELRDRQTTPTDAAEVLWLEPRAAHRASDGRISWQGIGLLALPIVLSLIVPAQPLGAGAISNRGISLTAPEQSSSHQPLPTSQRCAAEHPRLATRILQPGRPARVGRTAGGRHRLCL
jgi:uncharacterized membrane protein YcgQ (UPF0703/DUF1980 family)